MAIVRSRREREECFENSYPASEKREIFEKEAWIELFVVKDIMSFYLRKVEKAKEKIELKGLQIKGLESKIRQQDVSDKYFLDELLDEYTKEKNNLSDYKVDYDSFKGIYQKINDLYNLSKRLIDYRKFWTVCKIIPERRLVKLIKNPKQFEYFCDLVDSTLYSLRQELGSITEANIARQQKKDVNVKVNEKHFEIINKEKNQSRDELYKSILAKEEVQIDETLFTNVEDLDKKEETKNKN